MKKFANFILRLMGWEIYPFPQGVKKAVVLMGPHTSNWDFVIGRLGFVKYGIKPKILIKKEAFVPPLGWLLKALGGIPVDRSKKNNITEQAVKLFNEREELSMIFTPEGTRKNNPEWKKGFYYIALEAKVPILVGYMDYEKKIGGFAEVFWPTGDVENDISHIKKILSQYKGKHPQNGISA